MPLQHIRQLRMVHEHPRFSRIQLANATIEHGMDVLAGQARHVDQLLDIGVLRMIRHEVGKKPFRSADSIRFRG